MISKRIYLSCDTWHRIYVALWAFFSLSMDFITEHSTHGLAFNHRRLWWRRSDRHSVFERRWYYSMTLLLSSQFLYLLL